MGKPQPPTPAASDMHALRTAVLQHTTADGVHHDWLMEDPALEDPMAEQARLWTARIQAPPTQWARLGRIQLQVIPPHRRAYLTYQGAVSGGRGRVRRVATGRCVPQLWSSERAVLLLDLGMDNLRMEMRRLGPTRWVAVLQTTDI